MHLLYPDASPPYNLQLIPGFWCTNPIPLKMFIHFWHFFLIFSLQKSVWTNIFELNSFCALPQNLAITVMCALKTKSRIMGCESIFPGAHYIGQFWQQKQSGLLPEVGISRNSRELAFLGPFW